MLFEETQPKAHFYMGIDPGKSGAVALYQPSTGLLLIRKFKHPKGRGIDNIDVGIIFDAFKDLPTPTVCCMEDNGSYGQGSVSASVTGCQIGIYKSVFYAYAYPRVVYARPKKWKDALSIIPPKSVTGDKRKKILKDMSCRLAAEIFPDYPFVRKGCSVPDDNMCEAALIAFYAAHHV